MKKKSQFITLTLVLGLYLLAQFSLLPVSAWNYVNWGKRDLIVPPGETLEIIDGEFDIDGNILVDTGATLFLKDALLKVVGKNHKITFKSSSFEAENGTISAESWTNIYFEGNSSAWASTLNVDYGIVYFRGTSSANLSYFNYVTTTSQNLHGGVKAEGSSVVSLTNATIMEPPPERMSLAVADSARVSLYDSQLRDMSAEGSSKVVLSRSGILWSLRTSGFSNVAINSTFREWATRKTPHALTGIVASESSNLTIGNAITKQVSAYDSASFTIFNATVQNGVISAHNSSTISIARTTLTGTAVRPGVFAYEMSKAEIADSELRDISTVGAYDYSEIRITNSKLRELGAFGNSEVSVSNSELGGPSHISDFAQASFSNSKLALLQVFDSTSVSASDSQIEMLESYDFSQISVLNSQVTLQRSSDSSLVSVSDSSVQEVFLYVNSVNATLSNLNPVLFGSWKSLDGLVIAAGGYAPDVTLTRTRVQVGWSFWFSGLSNASIRDSTIESIGVSGTSTVWLTNSTVHSEPSTMGGGRLYVFWYLDVVSAGGAQISVSDPNGAVIESKVADANGLTSFILPGKINGLSGTDSAGDYMVTAKWDGASREATIELTGSQRIALTPPPPWWQEFWYILVLVAVAVVAAIALAVVLLRRRSSKGA